MPQIDQEPGQLIHRVRSAVGRVTKRLKELDPYHDMSEQADNILAQTLKRYGYRGGPDAFRNTLRTSNISRLRDKSMIEEALLEKIGHRLSDHKPEIPDPLQENQDDMAAIIAGFSLHTFVPGDKSHPATTVIGAYVPLSFYGENPTTKSGKDIPGYSGLETTAKIMQEQGFIGLRENRKRSHHKLYLSQRIDPLLK